MAFGDTARNKQQSEIEGLAELARQAGLEKQSESIFSKAKNASLSLLRGTLDIVMRPNYSIASAIKNIVDEDPNTSFGGGLLSGITGKTKTTFSDVIREVGFESESRSAKITRGIAGFTLDVLLDPITYTGFGVARRGAQLLAKGATKPIALSRAGTEFLQRGSKIGGKEGLSSSLAGEAMLSLIKREPALAKAWVDKGGIKFFGNTILSGSRIGTALKVIPGMKTLDKLTAPTRNALGSLFSTRVDPKFGLIPKELSRIEAKWKSLGKSMPREKLIKISNIAKVNKLTFAETGIINNAIEMGTKLADPRLNNARVLLQKELGILLKAERQAGIKVGELTNYVPHMLVKEDLGKIPFISKGVPRVGKPGFTFERKFKGTIKEAAESGFAKFNENIVESTALRSVASSKAVVAKGFLQDVAENFGTAAAKAPTGYVPSTAKELKGFLFHPVVAKRIDNLTKGLINDEATNKLLRSFDKVQNVWKASVTSIFPAFHGRNAISNVFLNFMDDARNVFRPTINKASASLLFKDAKLNKLERLALGTGSESKAAQKELSQTLNERFFTDDFGSEYSVGAIRNLLKNNDIAFTKRFFASDVQEAVKLPRVKGQPGLSKTVAQKVLPVYQDFYGYKLGRDVGNTVEGHARIVNFLGNLEKTGDPILAAERTKQFLFDYDNLTEFERGFMKRIMPFYTFSRKNIEVQVVQGAKQPGKVAAQAKLFNSVGDIIGTGSNISDEELAALPVWMQKGLLIELSREGTNLSFASNLGLPIEEALSLDGKGLLGRISPFIKFPIEKATGRDLFRDKDIKDVTNATSFRFAPQIIKDFIGYREVPRTSSTGEKYTWYVATNPENMHLIVNLPPTSRLLSVLGQIGRTNVPTTAKILQQTTGLKAYDFNIEREAQKKEQEIQTELEQLLINAGIGAKFEKFFIPKEDKKGF